MENPAPIREKRRDFRRWLKVAAGVVCIPPLLFGLSNLWLVSPAGRAWLGGQISQRTRLESRVGGSTWSPWNGITLYSFEILQPEPLRAAVSKPLLRVAKLNLEPVWRACLKGRIEIGGLSLESPEIVLPIELVSHLAIPQVPTPAAPPVDVVIAPQTPPDLSEATLVQPASPSGPVQPPPSDPNDGRTPSTVVIPSIAPLPVRPAGPIFPMPTRWLRLKNASLSVVSAQRKESPLFRISRASGSIPFLGNPATSELRLGSMEFLGHAAMVDVPLKLDWKSPMLNLAAQEYSLAGMKLIAAAKLAALPGTPVQMELHLPQQPLAAQPLPTGQTDTLAAKTVFSLCRFRGMLFSPATWQGDFLSQAAEISGSINSKAVNFGQFSSLIVLRGPQLSCVDARLVGDEFSVLGNASILADGRLAGILRIVSNPEHLNTLGGRFFPGIENLSLTALGTPQRSALDLQAAGNIRQIYLCIGKNGPIVPFPAVHSP